MKDSDGPGRPVVLIHGWRGFGRSDKPRGGYDYDTLAQDLEGVLDGSTSPT